MESLGGEAYIVGGAVRDLVLGKPAHDVDISTNVPIDTIREHFPTNELGRSAEFGVIVVHWEGEQFEVAQFREDIGSSDNRRPDSVNLTKSFEKDAARRDLSFNAMGLTKDGKIVDYYHGLEDLKAKIVRTVGSARDRFKEDGLRILRAFRFAAKLGFGIESETRKAASELKDLINGLSAERVRDEMFKAAESGESLARYIEHLDNAGILEIILPELHILKQRPHSPKWHPEGDSYVHTLEAVKKSQSKDPVENIAVLFHDLGKGVTMGTKNEQPTYYGHEAAGGLIVDQIAKRLRFSKEQAEAIRFATIEHMKGHNIHTMTDKKVLALRQHPYWSSLKNTMYSDEAARGPGLFDPVKFQQKLDHVEKVFDKVGNKEQLTAKLAALVNGQLIMSLVPGIEGKEIGRIKKAVSDWIIDNEINVTAEQVKQKILELA